MKNYNYNLVKLLHMCLDNVWRIQQHYSSDAENLSCDCKALLGEIRDDNQKHINNLLEEIKKHNLGE